MTNDPKLNLKKSRKAKAEKAAEKIEAMIRDENARLFQQLFCTENRPAKQSFLT